MSIDNSRLEPCDIIFVKRMDNSTWFARMAHKIIRWVTKSPYFHVAYVMNSNGVVFEANGFRQAGFANLSDYDEYDVKRLDFSLEDRKEILKQIISTQGSRYDYGEIISLFARKKLGINVYYDNPKYFICSGELESAVRKIKSINLIEQNTDDVAPSDLWECKYLKQLGE